MVLLSSLAAEHRPSITHGRWSFQLSMAQQALSVSLRRQWNVSTRPLDCCLGMLDVQQDAQGGPQ